MFQPHADGVINQKYNISTRQKGHLHPFVASAFRPPPRHYKKSPSLHIFEGVGGTSIPEIEGSRSVPPSHILCHIVIFLLIHF